MDLEWAKAYGGAWELSRKWCTVNRKQANIAMPTGMTHMIHMTMWIPILRNRNVGSSASKTNWKYAVDCTYLIHSHGNPTYIVSSCALKKVIPQGQTIFPKGNIGGWTIWGKDLSPCRMVEGIHEFSPDVSSSLLSHGRLRHPKPSECRPRRSAWIGCFLCQNPMRPRPGCAWLTWHPELLGSWESGDGYRYLSCSA